MQILPTKRSWLLDTVEVLPEEKQDFLAARMLGFPDYEDALVVTFAQKSGSDYIIPRDSAGFQRSPVSVLGPTGLLAKLGYTE